MTDDRAKPHAVFINRVYPPETAATGQLLSELVRKLETYGWHISVLTARANTDLAPVARDGDIAVHRVRGLPYRRKPLAYRALAYLSLYPALLARLFSLGRIDVLVIATDPPLFLVPGVLCGRLLGIPIVHWSHDLYPNFLFAMGIVREASLLGRLLRKAMSFALRRCAALVSIGRCMSVLLERDAGKAPAFIPNWVDTDHIVPIPHCDNAFRQTLLQDGETLIVMYSGNFGMGHPFDPVIRAMQDVEAARSDTRFVLIGDGPRLPYVKDTVTRLGLQRVTFLPYQDYSHIPQSLGAADIHLVSMEPALEGILVPSKIYGVLAAGRPCFFLGPRDCEAARIVLEDGLGEVFEPQGFDSLGTLLQEWLDQPRRLTAAGHKARRRAEVAGLQAGAQAFDVLLKGVTRGPPPGI